MDVIDRLAVVVIVSLYVDVYQIIPIYILNSHSVTNYISIKLGKKGSLRRRIIWVRNSDLHKVKKTIKSNKWESKITWVSPGGSKVNNPPANPEAARDAGSTPESGRSTGEGNSTQLQYACLENSTRKGDWRAPVHGVMKNWTRLTRHAHTHSKVKPTIFFLILIDLTINNLFKIIRPTM